MGEFSMRLTISKQIILAFCLIMLAFSGLIFYTYIDFKGMEVGYSGLVTRSAPLVFEVKDINAELRNQSSLIRGFLISKDERYVQNYQASRAKMDDLLKSIEGKLTTPEGVQEVSELKKVLADYHVVTDEAVRMRREKGVEESQHVLIAGEEKSNIAAAKTNEVVKFLTDRMDLRVQENVVRVNNMKTVIFVCSILVIICSILFSLWFARRIARPLNSVAASARRIAQGDLTDMAIEYQGHDEIADMIGSFKQMGENLRNLIQQVLHSAEQVAAASEELSASSDQTARASSQVAETIEQVAMGAAGQTQAVDHSAAMLQTMLGDITTIAKHSNQVSEKSSHTANTAQAGNSAVNEASDQMKHIAQSVTNSANVVRKLGEGSKRIEEILSVITQIAGQTNLLALNAAIEAARAGEQGKGFAVVAEEVRKLAEQSQAAAAEITEIVRVIQSDTQEAVQAMQQGTEDAARGTEVIIKTGDHFHAIAGLVEELDAQIHEISQATEKIASSGNEVASSVNGVKKIADETASNTQTISAAAEEQTATMEEIASASTSLSQMAEKLQNVVSNFKI
jgi:methyl-accepting chemotaxis protein